MLSAAGATARPGEIAAGHRRPVNTASPSATFYVAVNGNDANPGTQGAPFATLTRAQAATRTIPLPNRIAAPAVVYLRGGVYSLAAAGPLQLDAQDSGVAWTAFPGESVTVTGAAVATGLTWTPASSPVAGVFTTQLPAGSFPTGGLAPHAVYLDGVPYMRARYPNGNPRDNSGICFSRPQRPGEGCNGYSTATSGANGKSFPPGTSVSLQGLTPNRGSSPTLGCPQCGDNWGTYSTGIYTPVPGDPVYNAPLPGHPGWTNTSVISFWNPPWQRSARSQINTAHDPHWSGAAKWSRPDAAAYHTFHGCVPPLDCMAALLRARAS